MTERGGFAIKCCREIVKYVKCFLLVMQLPNSKWRPFLKIKRFISGKSKKNSGKVGILSVKKYKPSSDLSDELY